MIVTPLANMRLRTAQLASVLGASYGTVRNWSQAQQDYTRRHQGWDLEAPVGTPCRAIADGIVEWVGFSNSYGHQVILRFSRTGGAHSVPGEVRFAQYAHLSVVSVNVGQLVRAGDQIGLTGVSGNASPAAPHLHFEIRTIGDPNPGPGFTNREDPATVLGHQHLQSR